MTAPEFDVFLCHNSADKPAVKDIAEQLESLGVHPWLDEWQLRPGLPGQRLIEAEIENAKSAAVFVGDSGFGPWQEFEQEAFLREFVKRKCPVIPVFLPDCETEPVLPAFLKGMTWVDFRKTDPDPLERLIWGITGQQPTRPKSGKTQPNHLAIPQNLPYDSIADLFKGRDGALTELEGRLTRSTDSATALVAKQAIHGLGGIGKTRLAVEYAWRHASDFSALLYVPAETPEDLQASLASLCGRRALNLPEQTTEDEQVQMEAVLTWLAENSNWLLIFDSVDRPDAAEEVERLLPQIQDGSVLITSRIARWGRSIQRFQVDALEPAAAASFLLESTRDDRRQTTEDERDASRLAERLGCLPLALEQASAYISHLDLSLGDYLQRWSRQEEHVLTWYDKRLMNYPASVAVTWETTIEQLSFPARSLLKLLAWYSSDVLPREILVGGACQATLTEALDGADLDPELALGELLAFSMANRDTRGESVNVHGLVQDVTRWRMEDDGQRSLWLQAALKLLDVSTPGNAQDVRTWQVWDPLRPHASKLLEYADQHGMTESPTSDFMSRFGTFLHFKSHFEFAEPLMRRALAIDEASYGEAHPDVAIRLNNLAALLKATNRLAEAEPLMRRALAIDEASYGEAHPRVAIDLNNLAQLLQATNRLAEAEPLMRRALAIDEASYGEAHPDVAIRLNNLAQLLQATNRLAEAEPLMRRALAIDEASYGEAHPRVAIDLNNLAQLLQATNRLAEAEPLMRRALAIDEASYGEAHPRVAIDLNNLAQLLKATNQLTEAEPLMRRALAIDEASYGTEHPDVARDLNNLAACCGIPCPFGKHAIASGSIARIGSGASSGWPGTELARVLDAAAGNGAGLERVQQSVGEFLGGCESMAETQELILQRATSHVVGDAITG